MKNIPRGKLLALFMTLAIALAFSPFSAIPSSAASYGGSVSIIGNASFRTNAVGPSAYVTYSIPAVSVSNGSWDSRKVTVTVEEKINGTWQTTNSKSTLYGNEKQTKTIDLFQSSDHAKGGTHHFRLYVSPYTVGGDAYAETYSETITVNVDKMKTAFNIGATSLNGEFYSTDYQFIGNDVYFKASKDITVDWPAYRTGKVVIQQKNGSKWEDMRSSSFYGSTYTYAGHSTAALSLVLRQKTAGTERYRFYCAPTDYTTGGASAEFSVTGKEQNPALTVKYSSSKQRFKKRPVTMTIYTHRAYRGRAHIYDGNKKIKTLNVKHGWVGDRAYSNASSTFTLPKKLKKGLHKIKVVFDPTDEYKNIFSRITSAVKKIKVR